MAALYVRIPPVIQIEALRKSEYVYGRYSYIVTGYTGFMRHSDHSLPKIYKRIARKRSRDQRRGGANYGNEEAYGLEYES